MLPEQLKGCLEELLSSNSQQFVLSPEICWTGLCLRPSLFLIFLHKEASLAVAGASAVQIGNASLSRSKITANVMLLTCNVVSFNSPPPSCFQASLFWGGPLLFSPFSASERSRVVSLFLESVLFLELFLL